MQHPSHRSFWFGLALIAGSVAAIGCTALEPFLANVVGSSLSEDERNAGDLSIERFEQAEPPLSGPAANYLSALGGVIAPHVGEAYKDADWTFRLYAMDGQIQAFALPGGKIGVSRALAARLSSKGELAAVLGHEMAHVTERHVWGSVYSRILKQVVKNSISALTPEQRDDISRIASEDMVSGSGSLKFSFNASKEREADEMGSGFAAAAGFNPWGMYRVVDGLAQWVKPSDGFVSTHGDPAQRRDAIRAVLREEHPGWTDESPEGWFVEDFEAGFSAHLPTVSLGLGPASTWCAHCAADANAGEAFEDAGTR